jgi:polysaccharide pyruvyl transferase WcaK-like protein
MDYYGPQDESARADTYEEYVRRTCDLLVTLTNHGLPTRMLIGDVRHDPPVVADIRRCLEQRGDATTVTATEWAPIESVGDVIRAIADVDIVIAPRYHNLVLAILLGKPAISLSYHRKNDELLKHFDLGEYCHPIEEFSANQVLAQVEGLANAGGTKQVRIRGRVEDSARSLDRQYEMVLQLATPVHDARPAELTGANL